MSREGWRSEGGLLSDNCDNGLIGQWGPGDTGGGGTRPAPAAQRAGKSGDKHTDSATPARSAARGILQHVYSVECVDMKTVSTIQGCYWAGLGIRHHVTGCRAALSSGWWSWHPSLTSPR